jgi:hypothetical protein
MTLAHAQLSPATIRAAPPSPSAQRSPPLVLRGPNRLIKLNLSAGWLREGASDRLLD